MKHKVTEEMRLVEEIPSGKVIVRKAWRLAPNAKRKATGSESREYIIRPEDRRKIKVVYEMYLTETKCPQCRRLSYIRLIGMCSYCRVYLRIIRKPK